MTFDHLLAVEAVAIAGLMVFTWLLSLVRRDASIVDVVWGLGFVMVAAIGYVKGAGFGQRRLLVLILIGVWGTRLALHLLVRNWGAGEDYRYRAMRRRWGARFPIISLVTVFALQGVLMSIVSFPVLAAETCMTADRLTVMDAGGVALWVIGFAFESIGDWQLRRFKVDPSNAGVVMDRGLWRYTRHPNYFGDATLWWGIGAIGLGTHVWVSAIGPLVMTVLLVRVSGVPLLERRLTRTRPGYAEYAARTSSFFPLPPKKKGTP